MFSRETGRFTQMFISRTWDLRANDTKHEISPAARQVRQIHTSVWLKYLRKIEMSCVGSILYWEKWSRRRWNTAFPRKTRPKANAWPLVCGSSSIWHRDGGVVFGHEQPALGLSGPDQVGSRRSLSGGENHPSSRDKEEERSPPRQLPDAIAIKRQGKGEALAAPLSAGLRNAPHVKDISVSAAGIVPAFAGGATKDREPAEASLREAASRFQKD